MIPALRHTLVEGNLQSGRFGLSVMEEGTPCEAQSETS